MSMHIRLQSIAPRWRGRTVVVAATGPSLTPEVAHAVRDHPVIAVSDAYRLLPWAEVLYSCDAGWWRVHEGAPGFAGERWSSHDKGSNDKTSLPREYGVRLVAGRDGHTFSSDPALLHYGSNTGFQAINFAILAGARRIVLVGFDMRHVAGKRHFFGDHPRPLSNNLDLRVLLPIFAKAARALPAGVEILNATPGSALTCFPIVPLPQALERHAELVG